MNKLLGMADNDDDSFMTVCVIINESSLKFPDDEVMELLFPGEDEVYLLQWQD